MQEQTNIIHSIPTDPLTGSVSVPIYQTSTFVQEAPGVHKGYDYARSNNPTRTEVEKLAAILEGGTSGLAFSSGLAAIDAVLKLLRSGDEIIAVDDIYGGAYRLFTHVYEKFGIKVHYTDLSNAENIFQHLNENTRLIWLETPSNPTLKISDIKAVSAVAKACGILLCIDNTFASPYLQKPLLLGADIVVHSATKYLGGHSDLIGGLVVCKDLELGARIKFIQNASGAILAPFDSWLLIRGIETLALRVERHSANALRLARYLQSVPELDKLYYPGLETHANHQVASEQMNAYGGVLSFSFRDDRAEVAAAFLSRCKLFKLAESLGGIKSLSCLPAEMTHKSVPADKRRSSGVQDSLIRLSVGLEDPEDLIADIGQALQALRAEHTTIAKDNLIHAL